MKGKLILVSYFGAFVGSLMITVMGEKIPETQELPSLPEAPREIVGEQEPWKRTSIGTAGRSEPTSEDEWEKILVYDQTISIDVSAYTKYDDPGFGKTYANINFLPGGTLYDPMRPFPAAETKVRHWHYTVAVPDMYRRLRTSLVWDGLYWTHRYRLEIPGYTKGRNTAKWEAQLAVPRDRCPNPKRMDIYLSGWDCQRRAKKWAVKKLLVKVYRYDWVRKSFDSTQNFSSVSSQ